ncbi:MAG: Hsp33 family molecular chaperone HslO [Acidobacteria bacterium]|nr:Hsp33 family molecular chaperone HslO [Acidobacteriota bacterium]
MQFSDDHLIQATAADATIRLLAAVTTNLVSEACHKHRTSPTASAALGRTLTGALLLGRTLKDLERLTLRFDCYGPIGSITAEASAHGTVRGYVRNPLAEAEAVVPGKLNVKGIVGAGTLHVIREAGIEIGLSKEPYYGSVPIISGEIAEDLTHYLAVSEQISSALSLGVFVEPEQERVTAAGGYLLQVMPGADEETIATFEQAILAAPHPTEMIRNGADARALLETVFGNLPIDVLERSPLEFRCNCSYERAVRIISSLERAEIEDMLEQDNGAELTCHFCSSVYYLDEAALRLILHPPEPLVM